VPASVPPGSISSFRAAGHYDEIIVSTLPLGVSRWLKHDLVSKAQAFGLPVHHVLGKDSRLAGTANR
jgi:hypothetical protein